jgi:hypothetical protein
LSPTLAKAALQVLLSLTGVCPNAETSEKAEKWESLNRRNFAESGGYDVLRSLLVDHSSGKHATAVQRERESVLTLVLELFHAALVTRKHTTDGSTMAQAVNALLNARISLLDLCHHSDKIIQEFAMDLVKELFFIIDLEQVHELQESAREYGALLYALSIAVKERKKKHTKKGKTSRESSNTSDSGGDLTPTNSARALQEKFTELVEMFCAGNTRSKKVISRIFPVELFIPQENRAELISRHTASSLLKSTRHNRSLPSFTFDFELRSGLDNKRNRGVSLAPGSSRQVGGQISAFERWLQEARSQGEDWKSIMESVQDTHERPDLVWRDAMRDELRQAIRSEIDKLELMKKAASATVGAAIVRWDHEMFFVEYRSIQKELVVNGFFVDHLIPMLADLSNQFEVPEPLVLAWHLSDRLAVETHEPWKMQCLRCLRLAIRRYAMVLTGQLPTRYVLDLLRDHAKYSPAFIRECFLLLSTAIMTTRNAPSESLNQVSVLVATAVVDVLSDSTLIGSLSRSSNSRSIKSNIEDDMDPAFDFDEEQVQVRNGSDGLVRAGVSVLQAIIRRFKFTLQIVRPKRVFICRLLAVETLDHVTIGRILTILKQLAQLDATSVLPTHATNGLMSPGQAHSASKFSTDANWKSLALVYILVACCDPNGKCMSEAAAEFLKENYSVAAAESLPKAPSAHKTASHMRKSPEIPREKKVKSEFKLLLDEAVGFDGCGIGSLLGSSDPALFCEVFNADEKRSADVWWGCRQRSKLFKYLKRKFVASGGANNQADEYDAVMVGVDGDSDEGATDTIDDEIFVGNIFLRSYVEGDGEFLNEWTEDMFRALIDALFVRLTDLSRTRSVFGASEAYQASSSRLTHSSVEPWQVQELILKALVRLLPTHCATVEVKADWFETLLLPLRRSLLGEPDQIRGSLALELMIALLHVPETTSTNASICRKFLSDFGLATIGEALEKMMNPAYQRLLKASGEASTLNVARTLLSRVTDLLTTLSAEEEGVQALKKNPIVISGLLELSSKQNITMHSAEAAATSLFCISKLCQHDELLGVMIGAGGLLQLIEVCAFCPVGSDLVEPSPPSRPNDGEDSNNAVLSDDEEEKQRAIILSLPPAAAAVRAAATTLLSCLFDSEGVELVAPVQVLKQLLTPSLVRVCWTLAHLRVLCDGVDALVSLCRFYDSPPLDSCCDFKQRMTLSAPH